MKRHITDELREKLRKGGLNKWKGKSSVEISEEMSRIRRAGIEKKKLSTGNKNG